MRMSKMLPLACTTAVCAGFATLVVAQDPNQYQPQDNAAQAAARAALLEKSSEVNIPLTPEKPAAIVPPAVVIAPVAPTPAQPVVAVPAMTPVAVTPNMAMPMQRVIIPPDNDAQSQARSALLVKLGEPEPTPGPKVDNANQAAARAELLVKLADPSMAPQPIVKADNDAQAAARAALLVKLTEPEPQPNYVADNDAQAKARAALVEKMGIAPQTPEIVAPMPMPVATTSQPMAVASVTTYSVPSPVSTTKEMKLQELTMKYKANQITPLEYHTQRAAIVNGGE